MFGVSGLYNKARQTSLRDQANQQYPSIASASVPVSSFLPQYCSIIVLVWVFIVLKRHHIHVNSDKENI